MFNNILKAIKESFTCSKCGTTLFFARREIIHSRHSVGKLACVSCYEEQYRKSVAKWKNTQIVQNHASVMIKEIERVLTEVGFHIIKKADISDLISPLQECCNMLPDLESGRILALEDISAVHGAVWHWCELEAL